MKGNNNNNISELDCYDIILDYFQHNKDSPVEQELWKNKAYITLIRLWAKGKINAHNAQNLFILLINLFEDIPPDIFNSLGRSLQNTEDSENKKKFKQILKREIMS
jgi:hypothetical protein